MILSSTGVEAFSLENSAYVGENGLGLLQVLHRHRAQDGIVGLVVEGEARVGVQVPHLRFEPFDGNEFRAAVQQ